MHIEPLEPRRLLAAGDLDATFGAGGIVLIDPQREQDGDRDIAVTADGHILILATGLDGKAASVVRYNADGTLDTTFAADSFNFGDEKLTQVPIGVIAAPDGKILVNGATFEVVQSNPDFDPTSIVTPYLWRLNGDGTIDTTFGDGGQADIEVVFRADNIAFQPDGKFLVVTGQRLSRYNVDGSLDESFNNGGSLFLEGDVPFVDYHTIELQSDGKIIIAAKEQVDDHYQTVVVRRNADGSADSSFGDNGVTRVDLGPGPSFDEPQAIVVQPDGGIVVALQHQFVLTALRVTASGALDTTFGVDGVAKVPFDVNVDTRDVKVDPQGRLVLVGEGNFEAGQERFVATRLLADGSVDDSFGRINVGDTRIFCFWRSFDVAPDGSPIVHAQLAPNLEQIRYVHQLIKFSAAGDDPSPIRLTGADLSIAGTDSGDVINVAGSDHEIILVTRDAIGRAFSDDDVDLLDIQAGGGDDVVTLTSITQGSTIRGGDGNDRIAGSEGEDSISGNAGNDRIDGHGGDDRLAGNGGRDKLSGGASADRLYGGAGDDWLAGGGSLDRLDGGAGSDILHGNAGDDFFTTAGDSAIDSLFGDGGTDHAHADGDDDLVSIEDIA